MRPERSLVRFVRALMAGEPAVLVGEHFVLGDGCRAPAIKIKELAAIGVLRVEGPACAANGQTSGWVRRSLLYPDTHAAQHRILSTDSQGITTNLAESPLTRLGQGKAAFLERHHLEAGERVRCLLERAQLQPRLTRDYASPPIGGSGRRGAGDMSDMAADARRSLADLHKILPADCAGVVLDVCGLLKGLQEVERERGWPRRSAKLVLRIGLEQLAKHYGLRPVAVGAPTSKDRNWMASDGRPQRFE